MRLSAAVFSSVFARARTVITRKIGQNKEEFTIRTQEAKCFLLSNFSLPSSATVP